MRSDIKEQTNFVFVPLFSKQILKRQNIASTKNSQEFLTSQVPVLKRNKATNSSTSDHPFYTYKKINNIFLKFHHYLLRKPKIIEIGWIVHSEKRE